MKKRSSAAGATLLYSAGTALTQIVALTSLTPGDYGRFSLLYLGYALTTSLLLSIVNEAWARRMVCGDLRMYMRSASFVAVTVSIAAAILAVATGMSIAVVATGAVGIYAVSTWSSTRYRMAADGRWRTLVRAELSGVIGSLGVLAILTLAFNTSLIGVLLMWGMGGLCSLVVSRMWERPSARAFLQWCRMHRKEIRTLLPDSVLLDLGSIGTPFLLFPFLGAQSFGRYRAISNIAFPVRIILTALRPTLSTVEFSRLAGVRILGMLAIFAGALGVAAGISVTLVGVYFPGLGTVAEIAIYGELAGVFVGATTLSSVVYMVCRVHSPRDFILAGRALQTVLMVACPVFGLLLNGEAGAITGFVAGACLICVSWLGVLRATSSYSGSNSHE